MTTEIKINVILDKVQWGKISVVDASILIQDIIAEVIAEETGKKLQPIFNFQQGYRIDLIPNPYIQKGNGILMYNPEDKKE